MKTDRFPWQLQTCVWEITLACCFSCRYCGSGAGTARKNELTAAECMDVSKQLADMGCRRVSLIGGEVFMRDDWQLIVSSLAERNVKVSIITNGFLFSEGMIDTLKRLGIESVAVSIDGPETIHDEYRMKGSFQRALKSVDTLSGRSIPVSVITTLHSRNVHHLDEMYDVLKNRDIFAWQLQACSPMGNASGGIPVDIDFAEVIGFVEKHLYDSPFAVGIADNIGYYTESEGSLRGSVKDSRFMGCRAGLSAIGIDSEGNVRGCESMYDDRFIEGNLRERSLHDIWTDPDAFAYNRKFTADLLGGECASCRYGRICAGGCRSYNWFMHGKLYESPACARSHKNRYPENTDL